MKNLAIRGVVGTRAGGFLITLAFFLLSSCAGWALADSPGEAATETEFLFPSSALAASGSSAVGIVTDGVAAEELPHRGLEREEAEELLTSVFPTALEEPAGIFNGELAIEEFRSDHVAVVASQTGASEPGLLTSMLPLRTPDAEGNKQPVDLALERSEGEVEPTNPLVEVEIPGAIEEGISLPETNLGIAIAGAPADRSASIIGEEASFYPNVATDTDVAVAPTPTGVETFTQLRSAEAPETQTFNLRLPAGATLEATPEGGAEVTRGEELIAAVRPPTAIDAEGNSVPVSMEVSGDRLTLHTETSSSAAYPILVDPYVETFHWTDMYNGYNDWYAASNSSNFITPTMGAWGAQYGLNVKSTAGTVTPEAQGNWNYYVPRYFSDLQSLGIKPTSYIDDMSFSGMYFWFEDAAPHAASPAALMGIWDGNKGAFANVSSRNGLEGEIANGSVDLRNFDHVVDVKNGGIALTASGDTQGRPRHLWVPQASVEITDNDPPSVGSGFGPNNWLNQTASEPINFTATDAGLGMYAMVVQAPKASGGTSSSEQTVGCFGNAEVPCPRTWSGGFWNFNPSAMPQGEDVVSMFGKDPIGHLTTTAKLAKVKVDHTAPALALSGNLTEQGTLGTKLTTYTLNYAAADGDEAAPAATTPIGTTGTGTGQMQRPTGVAVDASGNVWMVDRENNRVEEFNAKGEFIRQFGSLGTGNGQLSDPRGIAISPAGNVWVSELGNKRLQEFSSKGEFIRTITYQGGALGQGKFVEPLAVATGPEETLWVTDIGSHRVYQFKENGTFVRALSAAGPPLQQTSLTTPTGVAVDRYGNAYVAEQASNQVIELSPSGEYVQKFGSTGSGEGQLKAPNGIAIAASGNVFVVDAENSRVEEFKPDGTFLRQFASAGAASNQLSEPRGIAVAPGNEVLIADAGNHRLARWTHADKDPQSGAAKVEVKIDGAAAKSEAPGCSTKNCQISGSWTLNADNYPAGAHKVEVIATDGVGLTTTKTLNIETHGDYIAPQIALSGTMTEQGALGTTRPTYKLRAAATDLGSAEERKSGVASETIKFDGTVVDSSAPGCPAEGCSLTREWTLESSSKAVGSHKVEVTATDAAGHTTTKTLEIKIERDTTAPSLETGSEKFFTAPEGWVEQKSYSYFAHATDERGYGVTSLQLKIDGKVVKSASGTCSAGGCERLLFSSINMATYKGGEHQAELTATDGAGNIKNKTWVIRVDPNGDIEGEEAGATIQALEETAPEATNFTPVSGIVSPPAPIELEPSGEVTEPALVTGSGQLTTTNSPTEVTLGQQAGEGFSLETTSFNSEEVEENANLHITPVNSAPSAATVEAEASAIYTDTHSGSDTIVRPVYDGVMSFQDIREPTAPESYSWEVSMGEGEELRLIDEQHAGIFWEDGTQAMLITVGAAHGANGESILTSLSISDGAVVTMTVHYHQPEVVYPIVSGVGWEGGFVTYTSEIVEPEPVEGEVEGQEMAGTNVREWAYAAPEHSNASEAEVDPAQLSKAEEQDIEHRRFRYISCHLIDSAAPVYKAPTRGFCGNPFINNSGGNDVAFNYAIKGSYFRVLGSWVKHAGDQKAHIACDQMLDKSHFGQAMVEYAYFVTQVKCEWYGKTKEGEPVIAHYGRHITPYGEWNWGRSLTGWEGPWEHLKAGLALYIWADKDGYIGHHETTCIDC